MLLGWLVPQLAKCHGSSQRLRVAPDQRGWGGSVVTDGRNDLTGLAFDMELWEA